MLYELYHSDLASYESRFIFPLKNEYLQEKVNMNFSLKKTDLFIPLMGTLQVNGQMVLGTSMIWFLHIFWV